MTAPDRIWIEDERPEGGQCHVHTEPTEGVLLYGVEYIRADLARAPLAEALAVPTEKPDMPAHIVEYTNYRGETARRSIIPIRMWWGSTKWHPEEQWMLTAWDCEKDAARDFAWQDMRPVQNGATSAACAALRAIGERAE